MVPHAHLGHSQLDAVGAVNVLGLSPHHVVRVAWAVQHASVWWRIVSMRRCEEAQDDLSRAQEMLVVEVASLW